MFGCPPGSVQGAGLICTVCSAGQYSPGGVGATCRTCPSAGASCVDGRLSLYEGYFLASAQSSGGASGSSGGGNASAAGDASPASSLDSSSSLVPCYNSVACFVNVSDVAAKSARDYGCAPGYSGPFCGVCDASGGYAMSGSACAPCPPLSSSNALVALIAILFVVGVFAVALKPLGEETSDGDIVLRILLGFLQGLGALQMIRGGMTPTFAYLFGFSAGISSSPLSAQPILCALGVSFLQRYYFLLFLPFITMACVAAALAIIALARSCCRRCSPGAAGAEGGDIHASPLEVAGSDAAASPKGLEEGGADRLRGQVVVASPLAQLAAAGGPGVTAAAAPSSSRSAFTPTAIVSAAASSVSSAAPIGGGSAQGSEIEQSAGYPVSVPMAGTSPSAGASPATTKPHRGSMVFGVDGGSGLRSQLRSSLTDEVGAWTPGRQQRRCASCFRSSPLSDSNPLSSSPTSSNAQPPSASAGSSFDAGHFLDSLAESFAGGRIWGPFVFIVSISYMPILSESIKVLQCTPYSIGGNAYMLADLSLACHTGQQYVASVVAWVVLAFFGLGFPLSFAWTIYHNGLDILNSASFKSRFGFLIRGYRLPSVGKRQSVFGALGRRSLVAMMRVPAPVSGEGGAGVGGYGPAAMSRRAGDGSDSSSGSAGGSGGDKAAAGAHRLIAAWESIVMLRKAGLILICSLIFDPTLALVSAVLLISSVAMAHALVAPYKNPLFNRLEAATLSALFFFTAVCSISATSSSSAATAVTSSSLAATAAGSPSAFISNQLVLPAGYAPSTLDIALTVVLGGLNIGLLALLAAIYLRRVFPSAATLEQRVSSFCWRGGARAKAGAVPPLPPRRHQRPHFTRQHSLQLIRSTILNVRPPCQGNRVDTYAAPPHSQPRILQHWPLIHYGSFPFLELGAEVGIALGIMRCLYVKFEL